MRDMPVNILINVHNLIISNFDTDAFLFTWDKAVYKPTKKELVRFIGRDLFNLLPETVRILPQPVISSLFHNTLEKLINYDCRVPLVESDFGDFFKQSTIVDEASFEEQLVNTLGDNHNSAKMFYGIYSCHKMAVSDGNYDVIIRCRPDLLVEIPNLKELIETCMIDKTIVFVIYNHPEGVCDQFFICSTYAMDKISELWKCIEQTKSFHYDDRLPSATNTVQAEFLLGYHIALCGLTVRVVKPSKRILTNYLVINNPDLDLTEPLLADLANQPNQAGKLLVEKYIEGKKNGIVFN